MPSLMPCPVLTDQLTFTPVLTRWGRGLVITILGKQWLAHGLLLITGLVLGTLHPRSPLTLLMRLEFPPSLYRWETNFKR